MKPSAPTQAGRAGRTILIVDDEAPILHCIRLIATIETAGRVTEVCKFSRLEDQIMILVSIPSITGEEGAIHCLDSVVPTGTVKVAGLIPLLPAFKIFCDRIDGRPTCQARKSARSIKDNDNLVVRMLASPH
jgi:hypothetical protein